MLLTIKMTSKLYNYYTDIVYGLRITNTNFENLFIIKTLCLGNEQIFEILCSWKNKIY